jgi:hypothetical protein
MMDAATQYDATKVLARPLENVHAGSVLPPVTEKAIENT